VWWKDFEKMEGRSSDMAHYHPHGGREKFSRHHSSNSPFPTLTRDLEESHRRPKAAARGKVVIKLREEIFGRMSYDEIHSLSGDDPRLVEYKRRFVRLEKRLGLGIV